MKARPTTKADETPDAFEMFWRAYPRRIGKGAARKAFDRAIRKTTLATMLHAIAEYIEHKPAWADYCHPSTWLNGERWDDEWTPQVPMRTGNSLVDSMMRRMN